MRMPKIYKPTMTHGHGLSSWSSRFLGTTTLLGGILLLSLLHYSSQAFGATHNVSLAWDESPTPTVTGYRVHYGVVSGTYANSVAVGNVTTNSIAGLISGVTYFFVVTASTAGGLVSDPSNEISFVAGLPSPPIRITTNKRIVVTVNGADGQNFDILATQNFTVWSLIGMVTLGVTGTMDFIDPDAASFPGRFYRVQPRF